MSILEAFKKQAEIKQCPICLENFPAGIIRRHLDSCFTDSGDEDCMVTQVLTAEDKKRQALEQLISLDDSSTKENDGTVVLDEPCVSSSTVDDDTVFSDEPCTSRAIKLKSNKKAPKKRKSRESPSEAVSHRNENKRSKLLDAINFTKKGDSGNIDECAKVDCPNSKNFSISSTFSKIDEDDSLQRSSSDCHFEEPASVCRNVDRFFCPYSSNSSNSEKNEIDLEIVDKNIREAFKMLNVELQFTISKKAENEALSNQISSGDENSTAVAPYYLTLFQRILKKVFVDEVERGTWNNVDYSYISTDLGPLFLELNKLKLVDSNNDNLNDLQEAINLLSGPSLKKVAKQFKVNVNMTIAKLRYSLLKISAQKNVLGISVAQRMLTIIREELGLYYRINRDVSLFFDAVFTLFSPCDMDSSLLLDQPSLNLNSQLLFLLLQSATNKVRFPAPASPQLIDIFNNKNQLYRYVKAKELEAAISYLINRDQWVSVIDLGDRARQKFCEDFLKYRCISHGVNALQRMRDYEKAVDWLRELLFNDHYKFFVPSIRGAWWDRLALNLNFHLKQNDEVLNIITLGVNDTTLGEKDLLLLQDRGEKLNASWKGPLKLEPLEKVDIEGIVLSKNLGDSQAYRFIISSENTWRECSVEEIALSYYLNKCGYCTEYECILVFAQFCQNLGLHSEGVIWHTIFGLLFYDVIFDQSVEHVWFSETQINPADLNVKGFYDMRKIGFDKKFSEIQHLSAVKILETIKPVYEKHYGETNSEISWGCFSGFEQIERFISCCKPEMLVAVFKRLAMDYRNCRSGFPDLTLWNADCFRLAVVEVKGPNDKLSTKQRLWLDYFSRIGVTAQVCHVAGKFY
ncbi:unnamed protein product [Dracunculus medinensis]|uniref:Fanconi-associated nuclease n=1 Tax=Dracunculus medinensis TaxID=318479 RepID=A0A0N4U4H8_DRAME|nr:unnamed protein product [Dracunculus medinensis]